MAQHTEKEIPRPLEVVVEPRDSVGERLIEGLVKPQLVEHLRVGGPRCRPVPNDTGAQHAVFGNELTERKTRAQARHGVLLRRFRHGRRIVKGLAPRFRGPLLFRSNRLHVGRHGEEDGFRPAPQRRAIHGAGRRHA